MNGFLYYIPNRQAVPTEDLAAVGLAHAFDEGVTPTACPVTHGPDGAGGVVLSDSARAKPGYYPDQQTWLAAGNGLQVGWYKGEMPTRADLGRRRMLDGYHVALADGDDKWIVPVIRSWEENGKGIVPLPAVPRRKALDATGKLCAGDVLPQYESIWRSIAEVWDELSNPDQPAAAEDLDDKRDMLAIELLAMNYLIGPAEVVAMGLFEHPNPATALIILLACDQPGYAAIKKKADPAGGCMSDGGAD